MKTQETPPTAAKNVSRLKFVGELRKAVPTDRYPKKTEHVCKLHVLAPGWVQASKLVEFSNGDVESVIGIYPSDTAFVRAGGLDLGYAYIKFYHLRGDRNTGG